MGIGEEIKPPFCWDSPNKYDESIQQKFTATRDIKGWLPIYKMK